MFHGVSGSFGIWYNDSKRTTVSQPFDAASKALIDDDPIAWLRFFGLPGDKAEPVDSDLTSALTSDRLLRISTPGQSDYLLHIELQVSYDPSLCHRVMVYHVLAGYKYGLPVISVIVLLRKKADGSAITEHFQFGDARVNLHVIKVWEHSPEEMLAGPPSLVPMLPLTKVRRAELPEYIRRAQSIVSHLPPSYERDIWTRMNLLMGMLYKEEQSHDLLKGAYQMLDLRESSTYRAIIAEGVAQGLTDGERNMLMAMATKRLGEPDAKSREAVEKITSTELLMKLGERLFEVSSWRDLLS